MAKRRKKKQSEINIDLASVLLILSGIILSIFVYGSDSGVIGGFIKNVLLRMCWKCNVFNSNSSDFFRNLRYI